VFAAEDDPAAPAALPAIYLPLMITGGVDLTITGLEITQGTQTASNSVPLVAGRATVARVYAVSDQSDPLDSVMVSIAATRDGQPLPGSPLRVGPKRIGPSAARGDYGASFNALLPQSWLSGSISLVATVDADGAVAEASEGNNTAADILTFTSVPDLDIVIVPIRYTHTPSGRTYPPPTRDTLSDWVMRTYPLSGIDVAFHPPLDFSGNLGSLADWERLLDTVTTMELADGAPSGQVYYALVPTQSGDDHWFGGGIAGLGWIGLRAAVSLEFGPGEEEKTGRIAAHELGHNLGRFHAPCGTSGEPRQPFPYADATIGPDTYGLDILSGRVWSPATPDSARDVMSYCTPQWMSDFTYRALYDEQRRFGAAATDTTPASLLHGGAQAPPAAAERTQAAQPADSAGGLLVRAVLGPEEATLLPVYAVPGAPTSPAAGGEFAVELLDESGAVLARHPVDTVAAEAPHAFDATETRVAPAEREPPRRIHALLPLPATPVAAVRLVRAAVTNDERRTTNDERRTTNDEGAVVLAQTALPPYITAKVGGASLVVGRSSLVLQWAPADVPTLVRYSAGGARWTTLGVDVTGGELRVDPRTLPRGGAGRFEVLPAGGVPILLDAPTDKLAPADGAPAAWISGPATVRAGEPALLYGRGTDPEDGALAELRWAVNGLPAEGGQLLQLGALAPGTYTVTLTVHDSAGQRTTATHRLVVVPA
jgi:hypothetical protein